MPQTEAWITMGCVGNEVVPAGRHGPAAGGPARRRTARRPAPARRHPGGGAQRRRLHRRLRVAAGPGRAHRTDRPRDERRAASRRSRLPCPAGRARALRLRVGREVARPDPARRAGLRGVLGAARLRQQAEFRTQSRIDVPDGRALLRAGPVQLTGVVWARTGASPGSRSASTTDHGSRPCSPPPRSATTPGARGPGPGPGRRLRVATS